MVKNDTNRESFQTLHENSSKNKEFSNSFKKHQFKQTPHNADIFKSLTCLDALATMFLIGNIASKISVTPKDVYLPNFEATINFSRSEFTCP